VTTPSDLLARQLSLDASRPLLTHYDGATGERVELSVATTANWVAKTANYLVDEHDVDAGDLVVVRLPVHWQAAVVLLASWATGARVGFGPEPGVVTFAATAEPTPPGEPIQLGEVVVLSLAAMGADFSRLVAAEPDAFAAVSPSGEDLVAAAAVDLPHGARVLSVLPYDGADALSYGLIAPLAVDGSVVLVRNPDPLNLVGLVETERVTHSLGVDVTGLPRLDAR
jgi:uncharacterized protein (TIGR03089 family)